MKLRTILFLCVFVVQKIAAASETEEQKTIISTSTVSPPLESSTEDYDYSGENRTDIQVSGTTTEPQVDIPVNFNASAEVKTPQKGSFSNFSANLYQAVKDNKSANFVVSPLSVRNALAMLSLGAMDETAEEIQTLLRLPANASQLINEQSRLISSLNGISSQNLGVKFVTADKIYTNSGLRVKTPYENSVKKLGGEIKTVDFGNGEETAGKINEWVKEKTEGKIEKLVDSSALNDDIKMFLLNTIYFKGAWENQFNKSHTKPRPFFINGSCSVNVDMMYQQSEFHLADLEDANAQVILLPYQGGRLSMMIYLPHGNDERALEILENWLKKKSPVDIQKEYFEDDEYEYGPSSVSVFLPKFKIRSSLDLIEPLTKLGLGKMFDEAAANFSGIFADAGRLFVSKASQEAFIEVNEEGTEAAAATGFGLGATSVTPDFRADRPFLFQIVDNVTRTVLFSGRVKNPLEGSSDSAAGNSQCIAASSPPILDMRMNEDGNGSCVSKPEVREMLLDFVNLLGTNKTETSSMTNQASSISGLLAKYGNGTTGAMEFIQSMSSTFEKLEKLNNQTLKIQKLEDEIARLQKETATIVYIVKHCSRNDLVTAQPVKITPKDKKDHCFNFKHAAARIYHNTYFNGYDSSWTYDATTNGTCNDIGEGVKSVQLTGSCVALYQDPSCSGKKFKLEKRNWWLGRDVQQLFTRWYSTRYPKSIGVCL